MFRNILNAISSVFKKKPTEVSENSIVVSPVVTEAPTATPTEEATVTPIKKKRTYTKKTDTKKVV